MIFGRPVPGGDSPLCREVEALSPAFLAPTPPVVSFRRMTSPLGQLFPSKAADHPQHPAPSTCPYWPSKGWSSTRYAHLAVPNHSARFYDLVRQLDAHLSRRCRTSKGG